MKTNGDFDHGVASREHLTPRMFKICSLQSLSDLLDVEETSTIYDVSLENDERGACDMHSLLPAPSTLLRAKRWFYP